MHVVDQCTCTMHAPGHRHACGGPVHIYNACTRSQTCMWGTSAHVQCMHQVTDMLVVDQCTCIMHAQGHRHACGGPVHMYNACTRSQTCMWWTSAHVQCMHKVTDMLVVDQCTFTMHAQGHRHACGGPVHMYNACTRSQTCMWWTSAHVQCMHQVTDMHVVDQCTCIMHAQGHRHAYGGPVHMYNACTRSQTCMWWTSAHV